MSTPYDNLDVMAQLPITGDLVVVVRESETPKDTEMLPWETLRTAWVSPGPAIPTAIADDGTLLNVQTDSEYLYVRKSTGWARIPYETSSWADTYNYMLRPVAPTFGAEPGGAPDGHFFYDSVATAFKFKQGGAYVALQPVTAYKSFTDGTTTVNAETAGLFKFRSGNGSLTVVATNDEVTHGDNLNFEVDPTQINVGDFVDDATYSLVGHNHNADYSAIGHNHDSLYAALVHNHDAAYAAIAHNHDATYAALAHTHAAADVISGTFADARISESSVTQHVAALNHDSLLGVTVNDHIDHSTVSILTAVGSGITGGGDLTANRSLSLDIINVASTVTPDLINDSLLIHDQSLGAVRRVLLSSLGFDTANHTHVASQIVSGVFLAERGGLGANAAAFSGLIKMSGGVASVATPGVDYLFGAHNHVVADVTDFAAGVTAHTAVAANTAARHTQGTDLGTTSTSFQLASGASGGKLFYTGAEFKLRNFDDSAYADLRIKDLYVEGALTEIVSNEVNIGDSVVLLNADIVLGSSNSNGGISVKLLDTDDTTRRDVDFIYNTTSRRWTGSGFTATTEGPVTRTVAFKHSQTVGNGSSQNFTINHKLNSTDVIVVITSVATGEVILVDWNVVDADNIQVSFGAGSIPTTNSRRVTVIG